MCEHALDLNRKGDAMPIVIIWHDETSLEPKLTGRRRGAGGIEHVRLRSSACHHSEFENLKSESIERRFHSHIHTHTHTHTYTQPLYKTATLKGGQTAASLSLAQPPVHVSVELATSLSGMAC